MSTPLSPRRSPDHTFDPVATALVSDPENDTGVHRESELAAPCTARAFRQLCLQRLARQESAS